MPLNEVKHFSHQKAVFAVASASAQSVNASGSEDGEVHAWSLNGSTQELDYLKKRFQKLATSIFVVQFTPDATALFAGGEGGAAATRLVGKILQDWTLGGPAVGLALNPDTTKLWAAMAAGKQVSVRELDTKNTRTFAAADGDITSIAWPGTRIATAQANQIALWTPDGASNANPVDKFECLAAPGKLASAFDSDLLLAAVDAGTSPIVRVWRLPFDQQPGVGKTDQPVTAAAWVATGPKVVTAGGGAMASNNDQIVQVWDGAGKILATLAPGGKSAIAAIAFDPTGQQLVWADGDKKVTIALASTPLTVLQSGTSSESVKAIAFAGDRLALGYESGKIELFKASDLSAATTLLEKHNKPINALVFKPDNTDILYSASDDKSALHWDLSGAPPQSNPLKGIGDAPVTALAVVKDGPIVAGTGAGNVVLWDQDHLDTPPKTLPGHEGGVTALAIASNGQYLVAAQRTNQIIRAWDLRSRLELQRFPQQHTLPISALAIAAPAADQVARVISVGSTVGSTVDKTVLVWTLAARGAFPANEKNETARATALALTKDRVYVGLENKKAFAIAMSGARTPIGTHPGPVNCVAPARAKDGSPRLFTTSNDSTVQIWKEDGTSLLHIDGLPKAPVALAVDPLGTFVAVGFADADAQVYEVESQEQFPLPGSAPIKALGFLPNHQLVTAPSDTGKPRLWDVLGPTASVLTVLPGTVSTFAAVWVPDADQWGVVLGGRDTTGSSIRRFNAKAELQEKISFSDTDEVRALAVSPGNQKWLVSGGLDKKLTLYTASPLLKKADASDASLKGSVVALAFHKDPALLLLAAAYSQGQVGLWTVKSDGSAITLVKAFDAHTPLVKAVAFTPFGDGNKLASLGNDGMLQVWDVTTPTSPTELARLAVGTLAHQLSWSPDGKFLIVAGSDRKAHVIGLT